MSLAIKMKHSLRFDKWARVYDRSFLQHVIFNRSHNMFYREMSPYLGEGARILDVGCGTGKFAFKLAGLSKDIEIHGVDISKDMIEKAKVKLKGERIEFKIGDVEHLPYDSDTFDIITCSNSFHHYPDQEGAVSEMKRVLREDGKLMIIDGSRDRLLGRVIFGIVEIVEGDVRHIFERELKDMLTNIGFGRVMQKRFNRFAPLLFTMGFAKKGNMDEGDKR